MTGYDEELRPLLVRRADVVGLRAAYRRADGLARQVLAVLHAAGLGDTVRLVVGRLDDAGRPDVLVWITYDGLRRLTRLIATRPGLLPDEVMHPPDDLDGAQRPSEAA